MGRSRRATPGVDGVAIIDKEAGWTSHDVVAKARRLLGTPKVGHSGTLDPGATGVLVLGVGKATRLLKFLQELPKSYECEIVLGVETTTLDDEGEVTAAHDMSPSFAEIVEASAQFVGSIEQVPPMVSAIKIDGRRLHELAREGIEVERPPRPVRIDRFDLAPTDDPLVVRAVVDCSSGTYIRSLAADLGAALGGGAHLRKLRRLSVGPFDLSMAHPLEAIELLSMTHALGDMERVVADDVLLDRIGVGAVLGRDVLGVAGDGPWAVLSNDGQVLAVYAAHRDDTVKPSVVLAGGQ